MKAGNQEFRIRSRTYVVGGTVKPRANVSREQAISENGQFRLEVGRKLDTSDRGIHRPRLFLQLDALTELNGAYGVTLASHRIPDELERLDLGELMSSDWFETIKDRLGEVLNEEVRTTQERWDRAA